MKTEEEYLQYIGEIKESAHRLGFASLDEDFEQHLRCRFFGEDVVIGRSERLFLRELKPIDLDEMYRFTDAGTEPVLEAFLLESREQSEHFLENYIESMYPFYEYGIWAVVGDGGELIGLCGLGNPQIRGEQCVDLGYYIRPKYRNQGYASEAARLAVSYAEDYLELPCLYAVVKTDNPVSVRLLCGLGFADISIPEDGKQGICVYQKRLQGRKD